MWSRLAVQRPAEGSTEAVLQCQLVAAGLSEYQLLCDRAVREELKETLLLPSQIRERKL